MHLDPGAAKAVVGEDGDVQYCAEETKNERTYPLITSGRFLTADEARQMYKPTYTLEEILEHIEGRATESQKITGYEFERMPESVMRKLEELGYRIYSDGLGTVEINWG